MKGDKVVAFCDRQCNVIAPFVAAPGNRNESEYTERLKRQQMREYGYTDHYLSDFEEDHLIPLEIGGAPTDPRNLWPEPHVAPGGWGSRRKDYLENLLRRLVCEGRVPLAEAQQAIARNWIAAYRMYHPHGGRR